MLGLIEKPSLAVFQYDRCYVSVLAYDKLILHRTELLLCVMKNQFVKRRLTCFHKTGLLTGL